MHAALVEGSVQDEIAKTLMARMARIAKVAEPITGVSSFPQLAEKPTAVPRRRGRPAARGRRRWPEFEPIDSLLRPMRLAEGFERLRAISDAQLEKAGARPQVLLVNLGPLAEHGPPQAASPRTPSRPAASRAVSSPPILAEAAIAPAVAASGCRIACLCGSDERYGEAAAGAARLLHSLGVEAVYLAGRPLGRVARGRCLIPLSISAAISSRCSRTRTRYFWEIRNEHSELCRDRAR